VEKTMASTDNDEVIKGKIEEAVKACGLKAGPWMSPRQFMAMMRDLAEKYRGNGSA